MNTPQTESLAGKTLRIKVVKGTKDRLWGNSAGITAWERQQDVCRAVRRGLDHTLTSIRCAAGGPSHWQEGAGRQGIDWLIKANVLLISGGCPINQRRKEGEKCSIFYLPACKVPRWLPTLTSKETVTILSQFWLIEKKVLYIFSLDSRFCLIVSSLAWF